MKLTANFRRAILEARDKRAVALNHLAFECGFPLGSVHRLSYLVNGEPLGHPDVDRVRRLAMLIEFEGALFSERKR